VLAKIKSHHIRKVLWGLIIVIIPAFVLWGSISYFTTRKKNIVGEVDNHPVTYQEFYNYIRLSQIQNLLLSIFGKEYFKNITPAQIEKQAWEFYLLLTKANKEKIVVSDKEVIEGIKKMFSRGGRFDKEWYFKFLNYRLRVEPRTFEEYIRSTLKIQKLLDKYIKPQVKEEEILNLYKKDNQKAKIAYIFISYQDKELELELKEEDLKNFYEENKEIFKEEPKVKIRYIFIPNEDYQKIKEELEQKLKKEKNIEIISKYLNLPLNDTDFLSLNSPIKGIGWEPEVIRSAFSLPRNTLSPLLETTDGVILLEKIGQKEAYLPPYQEVKEKVREKLRKHQSKNLAKGLAEEIINQIKAKKIDNLEPIAKDYKLEYKETDYFKYYDYVEGVGLNQELNRAIFSASKGEIIQRPFALAKGVYIIQVKDIIPIDEAKFKKEREIYRERILAQRGFIEKLTFLSKLEKELNLKIYTSIFSKEDENL
jgi:hypothetical protein